ncbi:GNAT family N-acetyltransferase [Paenibacillus segetis]|uniref:N-acetyltransferase domain-containing protein n=1 Tax=Paenibacillus segetis TaxID=1325360 RepID=A0ABQ1YJU1_9BACL|nr:GNAT family N-acetyltransferase [Paenibacillus segetis]GGH26846.1 hypothetical protein GCM10008013_27910 [Paenibacillus segetis]
MNTQVYLELATDFDAEQIRDLMIIVEKDETSRWYAKGERPYIPGFDSIRMQQYHVRSGGYYKILMKDILVGVILISTTGREHARIDRFYIDPQYQSKQIGSNVLRLMEEQFPQIRIWTLDTTQKSPRNHYFFEKNGYKFMSEDEEERYYYKEIHDSNLENQEDFTFDKVCMHHNFRECNMQDSDFFEVNLSNSSYSNSNMRNLKIQSSNLAGMHITNSYLGHAIFGDSDMSNVEICHVIMGGTYIHDVKLSLDEDNQPIRMERIEMMNSSIQDSNMQNFSIINCNIKGMRIDGILVSDLLEAYKNRGITGENR